MALTEEKEISIVRPSWTRTLVLAGAATCIGLSLPVGYNIGVVNSPAKIIKTFCNESVYAQYGTEFTTRQLDFLWSTIVTIFLVGGTIGSLFGSVFADKVGRKGALLASAIVAVAAGILFFSSKPADSVGLLMAARLFIGFASGLITSVMPMYLTELAPKDLRGPMGVLCPLGVTVGVLIGQILSLHQILGNEKYWPHLLAFYSIPLILGSIVLIFLPESPKYLFVIKKQPHLALKQLAKIRSVREELLDYELQELKLEEQENNMAGEQSWNLITVLRDKTLLLPILLVCSLQAGQQLSGINAVFYYSGSIFEEAGLSVENSELATIGTGCCNLLMAIISVPVMAKFNRRSTLQLSLATTAFCLVLLGLAITLITESHLKLQIFQVIYTMENDEEISKTAGNENQLHVGQKFSSYTELTENIKRYEIFNRQKFYKSRSRTVEAIAKQLKRSLKSSLEYYELEYSCIHGKERGKRGNGLRHTRTVRLGCGAKFKLRIDSSGNYLAITSLNLEHMNHNLSQSTVSWMAYVSIVGMLGFVLCYGIALGPVPYFIGSELFEVGPRPSAMALGSMANWGGNCLIALCFPLMQAVIGASSFFIFAGVAVALFFFVRFYMPETRGRNPTEIALLCRRGLSSRPLDSPINSNTTIETLPVADPKEV